MVAETVTPRSVSVGTKWAALYSSTFLGFAVFIFKATTPGNTKFGSIIVLPSFMSSKRAIRTSVCRVPVERRFSFANVIDWVTDLIVWVTGSSTGFRRADNCTISDVSVVAFASIDRVLDIRWIREISSTVSFGVTVGASGETAIDTDRRVALNMAAVDLGTRKSGHGMNSTATGGVTD